MLVLLAVITGCDESFQLHSHSFPCEGLLDAGECPCESSMLEIDMVPFNDLLLEGSWYPYFSIDGSNIDAIDDDVGVVSDKSCIEFVLEDGVIALCLSDAPHV